MPYTPTNWTNVTTLVGLLNVANTNTGSWFWTAMVWLVTIVALISLLGFGIETALLTSVFLGFIISLSFVYLGLASWIWTTGVFVGIIIALIIYIIWSNRYD